MLKEIMAEEDQKKDNGVYIRESMRCVGVSEQDTGDRLSEGEGLQWVDSKQLGNQAQGKNKMIMKNVTFSTMLR